MLTEGLHIWCQNWLHPVQATDFISTENSPDWLEDESFKVCISFHLPDRGESSVCIIL